MTKQKFRPNFKRMMMASSLFEMGVNVDQVEKDWDYYEEIDREFRKNKNYKTYKRKGPRRCG